MKVSLLYLPNIGPRAEIEKGRAGNRGELYDRMLRELSAQAKLADELGYESISFTEHHFEVEGFEVSNNPIFLDLFIGMQTKRLRVGQLGVILPANNPLRVAEDIAMLDHMTGGRANAGFARGYQRREVDILGQQLHGIQGVRPHQHDAMDEANRAAFEESFEIIKKAWTEESFSYQGRFWKIPPGETKWAVDGTRKWGLGLDSDDFVRQISVVPKPVQKPYPPIFQPFASSERSIRWSAKENATAVLPQLHPNYERALCEVYAEASGRPFGQGIGLLRDLVIADTDQEARQIWKETCVFTYEEWFKPFGFDQGLTDPKSGERVEDLIGHGLALVGTVDSVTRQLEKLLERLPVEWLFAFPQNGLMTNDQILGMLEKLWTKVLPRVSARG